ncbi:hypothetical protein FC07_GL001211 [Loigolactobacillus bifermentans DSM 20003]|uniref:Uncharacterized protein n=1 Tax=Loigolactobacillus bifermentans DSM 20003 TaxID=1423726 RepID=A0A0R1GQ07_9LACO|nr:hypothetical protein FC07_GL001211 [Loigolactobacillus bifermentans DSM 20003]
MTLKKGRQLRVVGLFGSCYFNFVKITHHLTAILKCFYNFHLNRLTKAAIQIRNNLKIGIAFFCHL